MEKLFVAWMRADPVSARGDSYDGIIDPSLHSWLERLLDVRIFLNGIGKLQVGSDPAADAREVAGRQASRSEILLQPDLVTGSEAAYDSICWTM